MWHKAQEITPPHNQMLLVYAEHTFWFALYDHNDDWQYVDDYGPDVAPSHWAFLDVPEKNDMKSVCY
jgi:hypothetical protein